jgi:hypothetical protein
MPYLNKTEVGRVSSYGGRDLTALFGKALQIDKEELGVNWIYSYKVRTKTVARLIGYSIKELKTLYQDKEKSAVQQEQSA